MNHKRACQSSDEPRKRLRVPSFSPSPSLRRNAFPYFHYGDVLISLSDGQTIKLYRLHSATLSAHSVRFRELFLQVENQHAGPEAPHEVKFYLKMVGELRPSVIPMLAAQPLEPVPDLVAAAAQASSRPGSARSSPTPNQTGSQVQRQVKVEDEKPRSVSVADICSAYDSLLSNIHNLPLRISTTNINQAQYQAEVLLSLARAYGTVSNIRPHMGNLFSQFRHRLFEAIATDPPRWLNLSISLQNPTIYTEAFVHLVGAYPSLNWIGNRVTLSPAVLDKVKEKSQELKYLRDEAIGELFRVTIRVGDHPVQLKDSFETWTTVQLLRDWLAAELDKVERKGANQTQNRTGAVGGIGVGTLFRKVHRGGDAYLPYDKVSKDLKYSFEYLNSEWDDLADDLRLLKTYAKKTVARLCRNNLMLDPEQHKIGYLTCTEVEAKDFPWLAVEVEGVDSIQSGLEKRQADYFLDGISSTNTALAAAGTSQQMLRPGLG